MEGMEKELVEVAFLRAITRYLDLIRWIRSDQCGGLFTMNIY